MKNENKNNKFVSNIFSLTM